MSDEDKERMITSAAAMLRQYKSEDGNGIDQEDAAGLCVMVLSFFGVPEDDEVPQ